VNPAAGALPKWATPAWPDLAPDDASGERVDYPPCPDGRASAWGYRPPKPLHTLAAREEALRQLRDLGIAVQLSANRRFYQLLVGGFPVECQNSRERRGDFVRLIDWVSPAANEWLAVNQYSVKPSRVVQVRKAYRNRWQTCNCSFPQFRTERRVAGEPFRA